MGAGARGALVGMEALQASSGSWELFKSAFVTEVVSWSKSFICDPLKSFFNIV